MQFKSERANLRFMHSYANHLTYVLEEESVLEVALRDLFCGVISEKKELYGPDKCLDEVVNELEGFCKG